MGSKGTGIRDEVRKYYGQKARTSSRASADLPVTSNKTQAACCCACDCGGTQASSGVTERLTGPVLGCGNPLDRIQLESGMDVLDLGSGAGREVIEAAFRVAPGGIAYGLDMTDDMLKLALENRRAVGAHNAVFLRGTMENIPLPDESVDVVISNCVINLSHDKPQVLSEVIRVLRPGGYMAVSDTVVDGVVPEEARANPELWCACVSGPLTPKEYTGLLAGAGFVGIRVDVEGWYPPVEGMGDCRVGSAFIQAFRPRGQAYGERDDNLEPVLTPANAERLPEIEEVLESAGLPTEGMTESLENLVIAVDANDRLVGTAGLEVYGRQALLRSVCVVPELRGRGLGQRLVLECLRKARSLGCEEVYLLTVDADGYFVRFGFRRLNRASVRGEITKAVEFASACPQSAAVMRLSLVKRKRIR